MKELNIGILIGNICTTHSDYLISGLLHGTEGKKVNTIFFMGAHASCFEEIYSFDKENEASEKVIFQFNTVFDYANLGKLDLLIIAYSTFYLYMSESKETFFRRFEDLNIPILLIGDEYKDYTSAIIDNGDGIRKCMNHLIDEHGCKKIGFLGGPKNNNKDARERLQAYIEVLNERGICVEESLIEYGDYSANSAKLFGRLLDNNPGIDAVVCANDTMALSGYEECKLRGLAPGIDIAITGFDDIQEGRSSMPTLTTVEQNTYDLGYMSMKKAIDMLEKNDNSSIKVPVYFKHRESCGSAKEVIRNTDIRFSKENIKEIVDNIAKEILNKSTRYKSGIYEEVYLYKLLKEMLLGIINVYTGAVDTYYDFDAIELSLRDLIYSEKLDMTCFQIELGKKMKEIIFLEQDKSKHAELIDIILHIMDVTSGILNIGNNIRVDNLEKNIWTTPFITQEMLTNLDDEKKMYVCLMERLRSMKIDNAYLFLIDKPEILNNIDEWKCPKEVNLVFKIENGFVNYSGGKTKLNTENGLIDILNLSESNNMAVYSLFSGKINYGILACELTQDNITSMYSVSMHIGSTFQFMDLTRSQRKVQAELEEAMFLLKNKNDILNMISEKDELTQIYNRRGFLENAIERMKQARNKYVLCIYADLDHLKQINDEFGHHEGDVAIKQAAKYLSDCLRSDDVVGRIGGDEFAAIAVVTREELGREIYERVVLEQKHFNQMSELPYYVEVTLGYSINRWSPELELDKMMSAADVMLYANKKKRRSDARKMD